MMDGISTDSIARQDGNTKAANRAAVVNQMRSAMIKASWDHPRFLGHSEASLVVVIFQAGRPLSI
jgi:hypothetical protein